MEKILQKKPEEICKDILKVINNEKVKVEVDENSKSSLYVFLNNTIYISSKPSKVKSADEQNKSKVLVIAHECVHSMQSKIIQILNFLLANLEIILFIITLIAKIFFKKYSILSNIYCVVAILSIIIRWYLEMHAIINSVKVTVRYMLKNKVNKESIKQVVKFYKNKMLKTIPLFIISLFIFKIIRLFIILVI